MGTLKHKIVWLLICALSISTIPTYSQNSGFVLIELYTSEGCSSCPSAEQLMPQLQKMYPSTLFVLEFHVDYWNHLGWKDPYSKAEFSNRQGSYSDIFGKNTVYTPQAIVNGKEHTVGSDKTKIRRLIQQELLQPKTDKVIELSLKKIGDAVAVRYNTSLDKNEIINIALVQKTASTSVHRGENAGKKLVHHNIVRAFTEKHTAKDKILFNIPEGLSSEDCYVVGYIQRKDNLNITVVSMEIIQ